MVLPHVSVQDLNSKYESPAISNEKQPKNSEVNRKLQIKLQITEQT